MAWATFRTEPEEVGGGDALRSPLYIAAVAALGVGCSDGVPLGRTSPPKEKPVTLLLLGDLQGTLEPCGCKSHPLGGVYRLGTIARRVRARASGAALLAGGDLLYGPAAADAPTAAQDEARAEVLADALSRAGLWVTALGELDRRGGDARFAALARRASFAFLSPPPAPAGVAGAAAVRDVGGLRLAAVAARPGTDVRAEVRAQRLQGAQAIVLLVHGDREAAADLARRTPGVDFVLVGHASQPRARPSRVGGAFLLEVGSLGEHVGRLDLYAPRPGEPFVDGEPERDAVIIAALRVDQTRRKLLEARKHGAPQKTVRFYEQALEAARSEETLARARAASRRPVDRNHFLWRLVPLDRSIPDDPAILALRHAYKERLREVNRSQAARVKAPAAALGQATYRGSASCGACHEAAYDFWKKTKHARAFTTLVREKSDWDLSCVGCHMTGYLQPGGSSLTERPALRNVGCESCHGPGSLHEDAPDARKKALIARSSPEPLCVGCHNAEHSDLFSYDRYLQRIVGPGHGRPPGPREGAPR